MLSPSIRGSKSDTAAVTTASAVIGELHVPKLPVSLSDMIDNLPGRLSPATGVPSRLLLEFGDVILAFESTGSGSKVNRLIAWLCCQRLPAVNFAHADLAGREQRPEQHRRGFRRRQDGA